MSFTLYDIISTIVIGAIAGWLAGFIMNSRGSLLRNIILGILGGFVGSFLFNLVGITINVTLWKFNVGTIIVSAIGACIVIFIVNKLFK